MQGILQGTKSTDRSARKGIHTGIEGKPDLSVGRHGAPHLVRLGELWKLSGRDMVDICKYSRVFTLDKEMNSLC